MSLEQGRDTLDRVNSLQDHEPTSANPHTENELPLPPKPAPTTPTSPIDAEARERMQNVLHSDIGISTLLNRLKQSISSARDFAAFLKERSSIEEKHAQSLKRLSRGTHEVIRRPESKGGSFAGNFEEMTKVHDRMGDNGLQFANALFQMHDEIQELTSKCERDRKHWKQTGLDAEKRVQDAENAMIKAKGKYSTLADSYDRARTGERQSGKFGIKGTKSSEKQEEDLHRKLEAADGEYASRVQQAQSSRSDLVKTHRPQAVRSLEDAIKECDAGLTLQLSKYAALNEKMLLGNGLCVSPLRSHAAGATRSLREIAQSVDNHKDFHDYVMSFSNKAGTRQPEIKYEKHPALSPQQQRPSQPPPPQSFETSQPQMGTPERTNTYDSFQQDHRPSHSGQISGVMPYQQPGGAPASPGHQNQYQPQGPGHNASQAPQLPQIGSFGGEPAGVDMRSPVKSPIDNRGGPPPGQRPDQFSYGGPTPSYGSGPMSSNPPNSYGAGPTAATSAAGFGSALATADRFGGHGDGPNPPDQGGYGQPPRSSNMGPDQRPTQSQEPPKPGFQPDGRGPSINTMGSAPNSRGPSFGQPTDFSSEGKPAPAQINNLRTSGVGTAQGPPRPVSPAAYSQQPYRPSSPGPQGGGYRGISGPVGGATGAAALPSNQRRQETLNKQNLPPLRPVFGVSLDELFRRDGTAVPSIVYQCVQAVDLFGLDTEGIYRTSGSAPHIMELKTLFDHDSTKVDFRQPSSFHHDIASVTTLMKHFFRDLPDPLLTSAAYSQFIAASKIDDDHIRRDSLHAVINALPDPNYATLRVVALHLFRVSQHSEKNRMTASNLAICLGPTLMGQNGGNGKEGVSNGIAADVKDAGWQARVVETILNNTMQIFDDDE